MKTEKPAIDPFSLPGRKGTGYPKVYADRIRDRTKRKLGDAFGLTQFGVNLTVLPPGEISSQRHWHSSEDEFVYIIEGEATLITDEGETVMTAGMVAGFPAGVENGHQLVNNSTGQVVYIEVGTRAASDEGVYPDCDMRAGKKPGEAYVFTRKDGSPFSD
ncbi:MAG: cupin domain-containing protein [Alphaproteobacteria bacterium]